MYDIITIGSATFDIFIQSEEEQIVTVRTPVLKREFLAFEYGEKIDINKVDYELGGGGANTAVNFANLGFKTAVIVKIGKDLNSKLILDNFKKRGVATDLVKVSDIQKTGFSVILATFDGDRTVLAHRGANTELTEADIPYDILKDSKWLYIAPLSGNSNQVLDPITAFAEEHNVSVAYNVGTTSIKLGLERMKKIIETAEVLIMNRSEASKITGDHDIHQMLTTLHNAEAKVVVITDGRDGAFAYNGKLVYKIPTFPSDVVSTLGAGDAFASTFVGSVAKFGCDIEKAMKYASVNAACVVQHFGAQEDFCSFEQIDKKLSEHPAYQVEKYTI